MLVQDKYNVMINYIEEQIVNDSKNCKGINIKEVAKGAFAEGECEELPQRSRDEVFKFLLGLTVLQYIDRRLMMYIYLSLITSSEFQIDEYVKISGLTEKAFYKKFKQFFGMSPKEAFERKIRKIYEEPRYWDGISLPGQDMFIKTIEVKVDVPVLVEKKDNRPYIFLAALLASAVFAALVVIYVEIIYSRWGRELVCFCQYEVNDTLMMVREPYASVELNLLLRKGELKYQRNGEKRIEIKIHSISPKKVSWSFADDSKIYTSYYTGKGHIYTDMKDLYLPEDGLSLHGLSFIQNEEYADNRKKWDGIFTGAFRIKDEKYTKDFEEYDAIVDLEQGIFAIFYEDKLSNIPDASSFIEAYDIAGMYYGVIEDFSDDMMVVKMIGCEFPPGSESGEAIFVSEGYDSFSISLGDYLGYEVEWQFIKTVSENFSWNE